MVPGEWGAGHGKTGSPWRRVRGQFSTEFPMLDCIARSHPGTLSILRCSLSSSGLLDSPLHTKRGVGRGDIACVAHPARGVHRGGPTVIGRGS